VKAVMTAMVTAMMTAKAVNELLTHPSILLDRLS
jgi:hypothetical protein